MFSRALISNFTVSVLPYYVFQYCRGNTEFTGKFRKKFFFAFCVNSESIKVYEGADSEFYGFGFSPIIVFPYENDNTEIKGNCRRNFFICIFVNSVSLKVFEGADIECYGIRSPLLCFSILPRKYRIYREIPEEFFFRILRKFGIN